MCLLSCHFLLNRLCIQCRYATLNTVQFVTSSTKHVKTYHMFCLCLKKKIMIRSGPRQHNIFVYIYIYIHEILSSIGLIPARCHFLRGVSPLRVLKEDFCSQFKTKQTFVPRFRIVQK